MIQFLRFLLVAATCQANFVAAYSPIWLYPIDATARGKGIVQAVNAAFSPPSGTAATTEVVIQTAASPSFLYAPYVSNGLIPYVQNSLVSAPNYTLFIVPYLPGNTMTTTIQYLVVGVEQIVGVFYSPLNSTPAISGNSSGYTSTFSSNVLPLYSIDPYHRAADIASITTTLLTNPLYTQNNSQVWIQTTLNGSSPRGFYPPFYSNFPGCIPYVQGISQIVGTAFLQITYQNVRYPGITGSVIVSAEQIQQIVYFPTLASVPRGS